METEQHLRAGDPERLLREAQELAARGQWKNIEAMLGCQGDQGLSVTMDLGIHIELQLLKAEAALRLQRPHEATGIANEILDLGDCVPARLLAKALSVRSWASRFRGYLEASLEDARSAIEMLKDDDRAVDGLIEAHRQMGSTLGALGQLDESVDHLEYALSLCALTADLRLVAVVQHTLGVALGELGQLAEAQTHFNHALSAYEKTANNFELSEVLNNLGQSYYELGIYEKASDSFQRAVDYAQEAGYTRVEAIALIGLGDALLEVGSHETALNSYQRANELGEGALEPRLSCYANVGIGRVKLALGSLREARLFMTQAVYESRRLKMKYELGLATLNQGILECTEQNFKAARRFLTESVEVLEDAGAARPLVKALLYLAHALLGSKSWQQLGKVLKTLVRAVRDLDLESVFLLEARAVPNVVEYGATKRVGGAIFQRARAKTLGSDGGLSEEMKPIGDGAVPARYPKLDVYSLGEAYVVLDGRKVSNTEWESQKARELFYYLLRHPVGNRREELLDVLWPEISPSLSRNAFYNNVYRARKVLYKDCIVLEDGVYKINPNGEVWFDLEEFLSLIRQAETHPRGSSIRISLLDKAVKLYRGTFLNEFYSEWVDNVQIETEAQYLISLSRMAGYHASRGDYQKAVDLLEEVLLLDNSAVDAHEQIVMYLIRKEDTGGARRRYRLYEDISRRDIEVDPPKTFKELYEEAFSLN